MNGTIKGTKRHQTISFQIEDIRSFSSSPFQEFNCKALKNQRRKTQSTMSAITFKVLALNELTMVRLRIFTRRLTDPISDFFESITVWYISFHMLAFIATSMTFAYQNVSNFFMFALRTAMVVVGTSQAFGMFLCIGCKIIKVKMLHQKLQAIVDQAAHGECDRFIPQFSNRFSPSRLIFTFGHF